MTTPSSGETVRRDIDLDPAAVANVAVNQSPVDKFREFLTLRGLKLTGERRRIVEYVFEKHNHFEAEQLLASMREKDVPASRPTVYRTLALLVEAGLLRELHFGRSTAYEHDYGYPPHEHFYCERCSTVIEFASPQLMALQEDLCRQHRFRPTQHTFIIRGICDRCTRASAPRRRLDLI